MGEPAAPGAGVAVTNHLNSPYYWHKLRIVPALLAICFLILTITAWAQPPTSALASAKSAGAVQPLFDEGQKALFAGPLLFLHQTISRGRAHVGTALATTVSQPQLPLRAGHSRTQSRIEGFGR